MNRPKIVMVCGTALLIAAAVVVVVASCNRQQPAPPLDVPVAASSAEVRVKAVVQKSATVGQPKSLSGVSRFGKTNLAFPVKLIHRNTGQVLYVLLPDLNSTLEVNGQILSSAFCSEDSFMQHLEDYRSLGVYIVTNMTNDIARDHLSTDGEWTVEAFPGTHEELFNDGRKCFATTLCCEASKVACNNVVTNGVIHSRWIVESSLNNTIIDNLPTERALIFDVCDAGKRVELNNAEKIQLRWCLADARIVDYIPIKLGVCNHKNFDYVLGIGELCKCKRCQEERSDFCTLVGADYAFVQSVVDVYLSKDGDSDIKFADDKRQQKFLELVVPKIQLLSIAK